MRPTEPRIKVEQLQPGLFIRIEASWFSHPFLFGKFKVKNEEQIQTLKKLGIEEVYYIPEKSDCLPKPLAPPHRQETAGKAPTRSATGPRHAVALAHQTRQDR